MMPAALTLLGAMLLCFGGQGRPTLAEGRSPWPTMIAAAIGAAILGAWWLLPSQGWGPEEIRTVARAGVRPVGAVVELVPLGAPRTFRWVELGQAVEGGRALLLAGAVASGLVALALWKVQGALQRVGLSMVPALAALTAFAFISKATGPGENDPKAIKALLEALLASGNHGQPQSFTVPEVAWVFTAPGHLTLAGAGVVGVVLALGHRVRLKAQHSQLLLLVGGALTALAPVWLMIMVGGVPWRPLEGAVWAAGLLGIGAALDASLTTHKGAGGAVRIASLSGASLLLGALALSL